MLFPRPVDEATAKHVYSQRTPIGHVRSEKDWQAFSVAEHLADNVDVAWSSPKEDGNSLLAQGDHMGAAQMYKRAALIARYGAAGGAFVSELEQAPEGTAHHRLADEHDCVLLVLRLMRGCDSSHKRAPNKAAAIAHSNRAAALLGACQFQLALEAARLATSCCPEYEKGHYREMKALEAMGDGPAALTVSKQIEAFRRACGTYPTRTMAALHVGWIDWCDYLLVYGPLTKQVALNYASETMRNTTPIVHATYNGKPGAIVKASLVPWHGGQALLLGLQFVNADFKKEDMDCAFCVLVDGGNGKMLENLSDDCGQGSLDAIGHAMQVITTFCRDVEKVGLCPMCLTAGQGLFERCEDIKDALAREHLSDVHVFSPLPVDDAKARAPATVPATAADSTTVLGWMTQVMPELQNLSLSEIRAVRDGGICVS